MQSRMISTFVSVLLAMTIGMPRFVWADTDGPSGWVPANPGCDYDKRGPCTDPHTYTPVGIGNGLCGRCGDIVWTYSGGYCQGTDSGDPNCFEWGYPQTITDSYVSTPVGTLVFVACLAATTVLLVADGVCFALCGGVCITTGVWTGGATCWACLVGCGAVGTFIICFYNECVENCDFMTSTNAGSATGCW